MNLRHPTVGSRRQRGLSLIEVLIAMLILAIGLLGIAAMQAITLRNSQSAFDRTQVVVLSYAMLDRMRANAAAARAGNYNLAETCAVPTTSTTLIQNDQRLWIQELRNTLGDATTTCGTISCQNSVCSITVKWNDSRATAGLSNQTLTTTSRI
jgi:type IV pilus assembly protein PilV